MASPVRDEDRPVSTHAQLRLLLLLLVCGAATPVFAAAPDASTPRDDVVDEAFGLRLPDPYRWMEGEDNAGFADWFNVHAAEGRARLDALPGLADWRSRLETVAGAVRNHGSHRQVGERLFFRRMEDGREGKLLWRDGSGQEQVLFDPEAQDGKVSIANYSVSADGRLATINVTRDGNEITRVEVYEVDSGRRLSDTLAPVWSEFNPSWLPDGSGFFYTRMAGGGGPDPLQGMAVYLHRLGTAQDDDVLVARADGSGALAITPESFPMVQLTPGSDWATLFIVGARTSARACIAPLPAVLAGDTRWRCLFDFSDDIADGALRGDTLYLMQTGATPYGRLLTLDLGNADATLADARVAIAEREGTVITGLAAGADALYVRTMRDGIDSLERLDDDGTLTPLALPLTGSISYLHASTAEPGAIVSLEGWTTPRSFHRIGADGRFTDMQLGNVSPGDYSGLVAEQLEAVSADGTRVPLSVLSPRDLPRDGGALAVVDGYGGYGVSTQPFFFPMFLEWVKAGHVYAYCHVRGGGEKGDAWRVAGAGPNKQRGVEDFIACAQTLAARGYATPARTAGAGTSMGGVLASGAFVTAPEAFGAMMLNVAILNPVRLLAAKNGANQIAEVGDPRTAEGMRQLLAMDPYQRVRDGVDYPPLLLNVGLADQRVAPWNSGKFAARVSHASPRTQVLIRSDTDIGHFATSYNSLALQFSDIYAWLEATLRGDGAVAEAPESAMR